MRKMVLTALLTAVFLFPVYSQTTTEITVVGDVVEKVFSIDQIKNYESIELPDFLITNHLGEPRGTATKLRGFPILRLLEQVQLDTPSPRQLSEFYFVFEGTDGYKVVFSWNELFNNPLGEQVFLITSKAGKSLEEMEEGLLILSQSDLKTGRRFVKNLNKITVNRVK